MSQLVIQNFTELTAWLGAHDRQGSYKLNAMRRDFDFLKRQNPAFTLSFLETNDFDHRVTFHRKHGPEHQVLDLLDKNTAFIFTPADEVITLNALVLRKQSRGRNLGAVDIEQAARMLYTAPYFVTGIFHELEAAHQQAEGDEGWALEAQRLFMTATTKIASHLATARSAVSYEAAIRRLPNFLQAAWSLAQDMRQDALKKNSARPFHALLETSDDAQAPFDTFRFHLWEAFFASPHQRAFVESVQSDQISAFGMGSSFREGLTVLSAPEMLLYIRDNLSAFAHGDSSHYLAQHFTEDNPVASDDLLLWELELLRFTAEHVDSVDYFIRAAPVLSLLDAATGEITRERKMPLGIRETLEKGADIISYFSGERLTLEQAVARRDVANAVINPTTAVVKRKETLPAVTKQPDPPPRIRPDDPVPKDDPIHTASAAGPPADQQIRPTSNLARPDFASHRAERPRHTGTHGVVAPFPERPRQNNQAGDSPPPVWPGPGL